MTTDQPAPIAGSASRAPRPRPPATQAGLLPVVTRMAQPVFAAMDGAHFDDLPATLAQHGLRGRSLFLGDGAPEVEAAGPFLLPVAGEDEARAVLAVAGEVPCLVLWSCPAGETALWGHLRRLNRALVPRWAAADEPRPPMDSAADRATAAMLFRHWDPGVLGALLPVLDAGQFRRVLGPAAELAYFTPDHGGIKRVVSDESWPAAAPGPLLVTSDQMQALDERRLDAKRRRIVSYLRDAAGAELGGASDAAIYAHVVESEENARQLGVLTEAGQCRWAYMMFASRGEVARRDEVVGYVREGEGGGTPDERVKLLMGEAARAMRQIGARGSAAR